MVLPHVRGHEILLDSYFNLPSQQTLILATTLEGEGMVSMYVNEILSSQLKLIPSTTLFLEKLYLTNAN